MAPVLAYARPHWLSPLLLPCCHGLRFVLVPGVGYVVAWVAGLVAVALVALLLLAWRLSRRLARAGIDVRLQLAVAGGLGAVLLGAALTAVRSCHGRRGGRGPRPGHPLMLPREGGPQVYAPDTGLGAAIDGAFQALADAGGFGGVPETLKRTYVRKRASRGAGQREEEGEGGGGKAAAAASGPAPLTIDTVRGAAPSIRPTSRC